MLMNEFWNAKWGYTQEPIYEWMNRKEMIAMELNQLMLEGPVLNANMTFVLLHLLPDRLHPLCQRMPQHPPSDWNTVRRSICEFDTARKPRDNYREHWDADSGCFMMEECDTNSSYYDDSRAWSRNGWAWFPNSDGCRKCGSMEHFSELCTKRARMR